MRKRSTTYLNISIIVLCVAILLTCIFLPTFQKLNGAFPNYNNHQVVTIKDQTFSIKTLHTNPTILTLEPFLSKSECAHMINISESNFQRSPVVSKDNIQDIRTSSTYFVPKSKDNIIKKIEDRVVAFCNIHPCTLEGLQVVKYTPGQKYSYHYDFFHNDPANIKELKKGGQRIYTIFIYLNNMSDEEYNQHSTDTSELSEIHKRGNTCFKKLNLCIKPKEGMGVFWKNMVNGKVDFNTEHAGIAPVHSIKYGMNVWIRENCFINK